MKSRHLFALLSILLLPSFASLARAETNWEKNHPGRTKLAKERRTDRKVINHQEATGQISRSTAHSERQEVNGMHQTVHGEAGSNANGGHLTSGQYQGAQQQQQQLGQQLRSQ